MAWFIVSTVDLWKTQGLGVPTVKAIKILLIIYGWLPTLMVLLYPGFQVKAYRVVVQYLLLKRICPWVEPCTVQAVLFKRQLYWGLGMYCWRRPLEYCYSASQVSLNWLSWKTCTLHSTVKTSYVVPGEWGKHVKLLDDFLIDQLFFPYKFFFLIKSQFICF